MDQRREDRFPADEPVVVIPLDDGGGRSLPGTIRNASGRGLAIELGEPLRGGAALRIDIGDCMLLGEVMYCRSAGESYLVGVELDQMLAGLTELARACETFEEQPEAVPVRRR